MRRTTLILVTLLLAGGVLAQESPWRILEPGLEVARFDSGLRQADEEGDLLVFRIDPEFWVVKAFSPEESDGFEGRTTRRWCELADLVLAFNAGMYQADGTTHVGYFKRDGQVINGAVNDYLSAAAFGPVDPEDPYFRIFDLDEVPLGEVAARYRTVIQNLRLIKRAGINRWQPAGDVWQELALGEDFKGRILVMSCSRRRSMHQFNEIVLALPLGLVAAQHLEGRYPISVWVDHPEVDLHGLPGVQMRGPRIPNVLGVTQRHPQTR